MVKRSPKVSLYKHANARAKSLLKRVHKLESTLRRQRLSGGADDMSALVLANSGGVQKDFRNVMSALSETQLSEVQHKYAVKNGEFANLQTQIELLRRSQASGMFDPDVVKRISDLTGKAVQLKSELAAMEQSHSFLKSVAASGGAGGMADYAGLVTTAQSLGLRDSQKELMHTAELAQVQTHVEKLSSAMTRAAKEVLGEEIEKKRKKKQDEIKKMRMEAMMRANELLATQERYDEYAEEQREKEKQRRREAEAWGPEDVKAYALREQLKEEVKKEELRQLAKKRAKELVKKAEFLGKTESLSGKDEAKLLRGLEWDRSFGQKVSAAKLQGRYVDLTEKRERAERDQKQKWDDKRKAEKDLWDKLQGRVKPEE